MKKFIVLLILVSILSGCATYKFQKPASSGSQGYLVSYDGKSLLEYTVGKDKSLPDLTSLMRKVTHIHFGETALRHI